MFKRGQALLGSRVARRIFWLFIACALIPVFLAGGYAFRELELLLDRRTAERLDDFADSYGMALAGRIRTADQVLREFLVGQDEPLVHRLERLGNLTMFARVAKLMPSGPTALLADRELPWPDDAQRRALETGSSAVLWDLDDASQMRIYLVRAVAGDQTWIYAELRRGWLWGSADDNPRGVSVAVVTRATEVVHASGPVPEDFVPRLRAVLDDPAHRSRGERRIPPRMPQGGWHGHYWEAFLQGAYATPSLYVVAFQPRAAVVAELDRLQIVFPAVLLLALGVVISLSLWQLRRYLEPVERLTEGTRRVAAGDFDTPVRVRTRDEFGELADSFNGMAQGLKEQFATLRAMAEVDRLLLRSPGLEPVLDALLPRVASVVGGHSVSMLLIDPDAAEHARLYEYIVDQAGFRPVRRVGIDHALLRATAEVGPYAFVDARTEGNLGFLCPLVEAGSRTFQLWPLRQSDHLVGFLCLGFADGAQVADRAVEQARDFADRLAVVLANFAHEDRLYRQAHFDMLTQLPNRQLFRDRLNVELLHASEIGQQGALLYIDLDHFKRVNDTAGHGVGDELLKVVSQRLAACVKEGDTVARLGGDEFAIILRNVAEPQLARTIADRILSALGQAFSLQGRDHYVAASVGITLFPADGRTIEELLKNGDIAMYRAKESGRGQVVFFEPEMNARMQARAALETGLHRALRHSQFELHFQPIFECARSTLVGVEALIRWPSPDSGMRLPGTFIPAAEESGLIVEIGWWVLEGACRQFNQWRYAGQAPGYVSVNVSARQLREEDFVARFGQTLSRYEIPPRCVQIEITESVLAEGALVERSLRRITELGVRIALDDFGTGYSSLSYLRNYPIDVVKIDRSFITDVPASAAASRLVETIVRMGQALEKHVVAEGVETREQLDFLKARGCHSVQGFLLARPMPGEDFARFSAELQKVGKLAAS